MAIAFKRIMLITRNVQFAIDVKRALEALGEYDVATVSDVRNAIEHLREQPLDLVLLDTANLTISPAIMIEMMRARQEQIAIVLAPDSPEILQLARSYRAQGVVNLPASVRSLIPVFDRSILAASAAQPESINAPTDEFSEDTIAIESLADELLGDDAVLNYTRRRLQASYELLHGQAETGRPSAAQLGALELLIEPDEESDTVRFRLVTVDEDNEATTLRMGADAIDETPVSPFVGGETVADLAQALSADRPVAALEILTISEDEDDATDLEDSAAFAQMLNTVMDESTLLEDLTMETLFDTTRELPGAIGKEGAIPAWLRESEKFISEPDFLRQSLPPLDSPSVSEATTRPSSAATSPAAADSGEVETPPNDETEERESATAPAEVASALMPLSSRESDPLLAQLALTMTQMMTDLTADATVLTRDNRIVAYSGEMPLDDFRALRGVIGEDWSTALDHARIRFVNLPESAASTMIYSRGSIAGYTLTMIFGGGKHLREIRRQGDRMSRALAAVPEIERPAAPVESDSDPVDVCQPFAFVWLLADPIRLLRRDVAEQLVFWLEVQLNGLGWRIQRLDVHQDFIYLFADVPASASPELMVRSVMERSRQIACAEDKTLPKDLWADAYLVMQPGREMNERELQRFLEFARA